MCVKAISTHSCFSLRLRLCSNIAIQFRRQESSVNNAIFISFKFPRLLLTLFGLLRCSILKCKALIELTLLAVALVLHVLLVESIVCRCLPFRFNMKIIITEIVKIVSVDFLKMIQLNKLRIVSSNPTINSNRVELKYSNKAGFGCTIFG